MTADPVAVRCDACQFFCVSLNVVVIVVVVVCSLLAMTLFCVVCMYAGMMWEGMVHS